MDSDRSDIVRMGFEGSNFLRCIVVVDAKLEIIGTANDPILPRNKAARSNRDIGELKRFDD